jgi:3-methyl-2-oxobutanoate hydroxymethyltransferase
MLTAYDYSMAQLLDQANVDCLLVGDSLGMVVQGQKTTVPVTVKQMIYHGEMVARAAKHAMVIVDLPFPVGQRGVSHTVKIAARIMKKTLCQAVKMEGGHEQSESIEALVDAGIPTIAHIGLRPQSVHALGGYRVQRDAERLMQDAMAAQEAGAFCILMECVPKTLAKEVTDALKVPTIGIGAGNGCDGQVLVIHDLLGMGEGHSPKFVRAYANLRQATVDAVARFRQDITSGDFPGPAESFE